MWEKLKQTLNSKQDRMLLETKANRIGWPQMTHFLLLAQLLQHTLVRKFTVAWFWFCLHNDTETLSRPQKEGIADFLGVILAKCLP